MTNIPNSNPDFLDLSKIIKKNIFNTLNCVQVGEIKEYDAAKATASIQIMVKRVFTDRTLSYPLLINCPVFMLQGGTGSVYVPIKAGDTCIVLFADRNIDIWHTAGIEAAPENSRCHDLADGIALVGIRSLMNPPTARASEEVGMANGAARVSVAGGKVNIENATASLMALIEGLIDVLKGLQVEDSGAKPLTTASIAALEAQKAEFAGLLYED